MLLCIQQTSHETTVGHNTHQQSMSFESDYRKATVFSSLFDAIVKNLIVLPTCRNFLLHGNARLMGVFYLRYPTAKTADILVCTYCQKMKQVRHKLSNSVRNRTVLISSSMYKQIHRYERADRSRSNKQVEFIPHFWAE